ncbi:hypothetical protein [Algivirga pacifica]|uniref:Protein SirB1 N-terminal domain-containing protein n=1 Tax=Algivirga pacifica TaxID=1162670 RepID=A0ABP9CZQ3_9BACT
MKYYPLHIITLVGILLLGFSAEGQFFSRQVTHTPLEYYVLNNTDQAWEKDPLYAFLSVEQDISSEDIAELKEELALLTETLIEKKETLSEQKLVAYLYKTVQKQYLKHYTPISTFRKTLTEGTYDCLTGTMLYAYLLEQIGLEYQIYETNVHVYLKVSLKRGKEILIESTDPYRGFVSNQKDITSRENKYRAKALKGDTNMTVGTQVYTYRQVLHQPVSLMEIAGLQYFNRAIQYFNQKNWREAYIALQKTKCFYGSSRIVELEALLEDRLNTKQMYAILNQEIHLK